MNTDKHWSKCMGIFLIDLLYAFTTWLHPTIAIIHIVHVLETQLPRLLSLLFIYFFFRFSCTFVFHMYKKAFRSRKNNSDLKWLALEFFFISIPLGLLLYLFFIFHLCYAPCFNWNQWLDWLLLRRYLLVLKYHFSTWVFV